MKKKLGLVLTGGGVRMAYQAGVLSGISDINQSRGKAGIENPFQIITGSSAGSLNATGLAMYHNDFKYSTELLCSLWRSITTDKLYKLNMNFILKSGALGQLGKLVGVFKPSKSASLLDTSPFLSFIRPYLKFPLIQRHIDTGTLEALCVMAVNYSNGTSTAFFQSSDACLPWYRARRSSQRTKITTKHIMASGALPILFPPVRINRHYYGDGSLRNYTPLSAAINLGATKLLVITGQSIDAPVPVTRPSKPALPSTAQTLGVLLNTLIIDAVDFDTERVNRINSSIAKLPNQAHPTLKPIELLKIQPSQDLGQLSINMQAAIPKTMRKLMSKLGNSGSSGELMSYLLSEPVYTQALINLGYNDALNQKETIRQFLA